MKVRFAHLAFAVLLALPAGSDAQTARVFVASNGNDADACSRVAPCRNFNAALNAVQSGGEIIVLDSAGYGPMTITKPVSVIASPGVYAGVAATAGTAVTIAAPGATVVLRGLSIHGTGGITGIDVTSAGVLHVEHCDIAGFTHHGVSFTTAGVLFFDDSAARDNGWYGIEVRPPSGVVKGSVARSLFENNDVGVHVSGWDSGAGSSMTIADSTLVRSVEFGVWVQVASINVRRCTIARNYVGINVSASATMNAAGSLISGNSGYGIYCNVSTCRSFGDNELTGNATATYGTIGPITPQ